MHILCSFLKTWRYTHTLRVYGVCFVLLASDRNHDCDPEPFGAEKLNHHDQRALILVKTRQGDGHGCCFVFFLGVKDCCCGEERRTAWQEK
jgi:hypothetical protein